ncbi:MAG TPA: transcription-repair coupling factor [Bacteroidales bacterium]|nr:transcription-repair coupling factor [Bacteroidales bacterium]
MLFESYINHPYIREIAFLLTKHPESVINIKNLSGSSLPLAISALQQSLHQNILFVFPDKEQAMYAYTDFVHFLGENNVNYLPTSYKRKLKNQHFDPTHVILRNECIEKIASAHQSIFVTYPEALSEKVMDKSLLSKNTLQINQNEEIDIEFVEEILLSYKFEYVDFVFKPGQFSRRGGIIDVFSFSAEKPYRIEFRNDKIYSLRTFDFENQTSLEERNSIVITPNLSENFQSEMEGFVLDYFETKPIVLTVDTVLFEQQIKQFQTDRFIHPNEEKNNISSFSYDEIIKKIEQFSWVEYGQAIRKHNYQFIFNTSPQPSFNKNFELLQEDILQKHEVGYQLFFLVEQESQQERLRDILSNLGVIDWVNFKNQNISQGFIEHDLKIAYYTEHQFFNRFFKHKVRDRFLQSESLTINEFSSLKPGDYIVHIDHGIGIFGGLEKIEINGKWQEQIKLVFKDNALVYVSIHNLHKISKFRGKDSEAPKLSKLGSGSWQKIKLAAKQKAKDIARDLIKLYAERIKQQGFAFSPDTYLQEELEASFFYEDTPDQSKATKAIKQDMESKVPMDRLVCGDVGFGKTEVAIRAAFKAVADNKQVAVLVPTTLLALQHYLTFKERLQKFPCQVEYLTRLKTAKQEKEILEKVKNGQIDILIGTHKLLSKKLEFKDLGLLIIDEEQKFGVAAKEKLRQLKVNIDTLTLTATPIPRTLQFSLMGARDLSVIQTPPPNRQPIITEIHTFNKEVIKKAIDFEIGRGGQVFLIHNRVETIHEIEKTVHELCPDVSIAVGHGQMNPVELEKIMIDFIEGTYDILISTTIIENGIDIPNANTIIINNGHMFGLSDLHQLRGRVGRTNRKAFCYILTPPFDSLPTDARKRLRAIEEFSDLGSGFYIALQDLDIRGAGNLLGAEQSGFIAEMGYDTYQKILQEAIQEIRDEELNNEPQSSENDLFELKPKNIVYDCTFESDLQLFIPEYYVENVAERIRLYKELDAIENEEEIAVFRQKLVDRFGTIPKEVEGLFDVLRIRWLSQKLGFEKISLKMNKLTCYFISNKQSNYYESNVFKNILGFLQSSHNQIILKEHNERLYLQFNNINHLQKALSLLQQLYQTIFNLT